MATSILLACGLNDPQQPLVTFIPEQSGVDGSFLIGCILGQRLKISDSGTVLICLHNTFQHYSNACMRLGFNLTQAVSKGGLKVIDPLSDINENLFDSQFLAATQEDLLNAVWENIEEGLFPFENKPCVTVIIDDLSALINLGASTDAICKFARRLCHMNKKIPNLNCVLKLNNSTVYKYVRKYIEDMSEMTIEIQKLHSGNFREVDGKLNLLRKDTGITKEILYKVNERNIKIFAPGEVGVKL